MRKNTDRKTSEYGHFSRSAAVFSLLEKSAAGKFFLQNFKLQDCNLSLLTLS